MLPTQPLFSERAPSTGEYKERVVRQLAFGFTPRINYVIRFPSMVEKELVRHMARAILKVARNTEGGTNHDDLREKQQDN